MLTQFYSSAKLRLRGTAASWVKASKSFVNLVSASEYSRRAWPYYGATITLKSYNALRLPRNATVSLPRPDIDLPNRIRKQYCTQEMLHDSGPFSEAEYEVIARWKKILDLSPASGVAVFILGPMAAGKSTVLNEEFRNHEVYGKFAYIDTDEIMESLQGFSSDKVEQWYPVARRLAIHLTDWLLENRISFVAEGTCVRYDELEDYMERLLAVGYKIEVRRVCGAPLDIVLERARRRQNRRIRVEVVEEIYHDCLNGLKDLSVVNASKGLYKEI